MREDDFLSTYAPTDNPNVWHHLPWLAQEVTAQQMLGTNGMVEQVCRDGTRTQRPVHVGDWLLLYPDGYIEVIDRMTFSIQFRRANEALAA